ncbi:MAG TPA: nickel-binding protein [Rhizomicrobium sp.]|nr:nickel-binding protein [Rhizomicrobium sp.]
MPMFIDIHDLPNATADVVAQAHAMDVQIQDRFGVNYFKYWVNEKHGKVFCLCTAPSAEAAHAVHMAAHALGAARILEVTPEMAEAFMGAAEIDGSGAALLPGSAERDTGTRTVMFTDIVGSTGLTEQLGDDAAMDVVEAHDRVVREALAAAGGRQVKHTGDGIMSVFNSASSAIRCAMKIQQDIARFSAEHPTLAFQVRIGAAAGEPVERQHDFFGAAVQLAARLCAHAEPQQILISGTVADLCIGKSLPIADAGTVTLKGFAEPVRAHRISV